MARRESAAATKALALAAAGVYQTEIARQTGYTTSGVHSLLKRHGIKAASCAGQAAKKPTNVVRAEKMASMYRQGLTLKKIGQHFGISRERVRQIIARDGLTAADGGARKVASAKLQDRKNKKDAKSIAKWGLGSDEMKLRRSDGTLTAFRSQKSAAAARAIEWTLTFPQWLGVWLDSGKLAERGRGKGKYVMSRVKDEGGYALGNVHIQLSTENNADAVAIWDGKVKVNRGVHYIYPGLSKPWVVKVCHKQVGAFATEEDAIAARLAYIAANGMTINRSGQAQRRAR
jgi:hypothetical protein